MSVTFISSNSVAQNCSCLLQRQLDSLERNEAYAKILQVYSSGAIPLRPNFIGFSYAIEASMKLQDTILVRKYVVLSIENQDFNSVENLLYNYPDMKGYIKTDSLSKIFDSLSNCWLQFLNNSMREDIGKIIERDQHIRNLYNATNRKDSIELKHIAILMEETDSLNEVELKQIVQKNERFPGVSDIGKKSLRLFNILMVHYVNRMDTSFYFPYIQSGIINNELSPHFYTQIYDRRQYRFDLPLLYGDYTIDKGDSITYPEIERINELDKRRSFFCLQPLWKEKLINSKLQLPKHYDKEKQQH